MTRETNQSLNELLNTREKFYWKKEEDLILFWHWESTKDEEKKKIEEKLQNV